MNMLSGNRRRDGDLPLARPTAAMVVHEHPLHRVREDNHHSSFQPNLISRLASLQTFVSTLLLRTYARANYVRKSGGNSWLGNIGTAL